MTLAINEELRKAVEKAVRDTGQSASLSQRMIAWLNDMGQRELLKQEQSRHLVNVRSAVELNLDTNDEG